MAITEAPSLRNLAEIWSNPEDLATSKFFQMLLIVVTSTLCRKKNPTFISNLLIKIFSSFDSKFISWA